MFTVLTGKTCWKSSFFPRKLKASVKEQSMITVSTLKGFSSTANPCSGLKQVKEEGQVRHISLEAVQKLLKAPDKKR